MQKVLLFLGSVLIVLGCFAIATVQYNTHKQTDLQRQNTAIKQANDTLKEHDLVNAKLAESLRDRVSVLSQQQVTLCTQIHAAKLSQPFCPQ